MIMTIHARLLNGAGHRAIILTGRGDPQSVGLEGQVIPELDSRHPGILAAQKALLAGDPGSQAAFASWVERICLVLSEALVGTDVCIVHNAFTLHKNLALTVALSELAARGEGAARWIAWCHDLAWNNPLYKDELREGWPWDRLKTRLPNVLYVAISEQRRAEMSALFDVSLESIHLVPNGIDPASLLPISPQMAELRSHLDLDRRDCVLLAPVRVTRRKNLRLALEITAALKAQAMRPLLVITGPPGPHNVRSDEYLNELLVQRKELGLESEAVFLALEGTREGQLEVSDALMNELYWWSDALLVTSEQEGFGLPLLEAALARLPIFCSNIPVLREVGGDNASYFSLATPPDQIARMIIETLERPGIAAMRRKVLSTYNWQEIFRERMLPLLT